MGKKKRHNPHHNSARNGQNAKPNVALLEEEESPKAKDTEMPNEGQKKAESDKHPSRIMRFKAWFKAHGRTTDWLIASFTVVLGFVGALQTCTLRNQLTYMRREERPWIKVELAGDKFPDQIVSAGVGRTVTLPLNYTNIGKTPAREVNAVAAVEIVDSAQPPNLPPVNGSITGLVARHVALGFMFPGQKPVVDYVTRSKTLDGKTAVEDPLTDDEQRALNEGRKYLVVWSVANYWDTFGVHHWTAFCDWHFYGQVAVPVNAMSCTRYNDADQD